jgi:hypothetical protein
MAKRKNSSAANKSATVPSLEQLEDQLQKISVTWLGMDRRKLHIAREGGLVVGKIKGALKKEGKEFSSWCAEKEKAGVIRVGQRTLQKWMRVNRRWATIAARANQDGVDPEQLGLDQALTYAARPKPAVTDTPLARDDGGVNKPKNKFKLRWEVRGLVSTDLEKTQLQQLFDKGEVLLKPTITVLEKSGRWLLDVVEVECAAEVAVDDV